MFRESEIRKVVEGKRWACDGNMLKITMQTKIYDFNEDNLLEGESTMILLNSSEAWGMRS